MRSSSANLAVLFTIAPVVASFGLGRLSALGARTTGLHPQPHGCSCDGEERRSEMREGEGEGEGEGVRE
jgi:hypothetical protein